MTPGPRPSPSHKLPTPTPTPVTAGSGAGIAADVTSVRAMASVRADGPTFAPPWEQAATRLMATSWRSHRGGWAVVRTGLQGASSTSGIEVSPREINFLADSGRVQITVVNNLAVDVHDVSLTLVPDNPRWHPQRRPAHRGTVPHDGNLQGIGTHRLLQNDVEFKNWAW